MWQITCIFTYIEVYEILLMLLELCAYQFPF